MKSGRNAWGSQSGLEVLRFGKDGIEAVEENGRDTDIMKRLASEKRSEGKGE